VLLELKSTKKYFLLKKGLLSRGSGVLKAVDDVSLNIEKGQNIGIVGESGSGKSTLAKLITQLYPVTSGSIEYEGKNVRRMKREEMLSYRKNVQIIFQDPYSSLDPRYTVRSILKEATILIQNQFRNDQEKEVRMQQLLTAVHLQPQMLNRYPHEFSGGERQRIAIVRGLILNPKLLILDEAVSSLDVLIQSQIVELLLKLQKEFSLTYLFITHNLKVAKKISHKIAVMYQGKIVELATTKEIFNNPLHPYTKSLLIAAIQYKTSTDNEEIVIPPGAQLRDHGQDHFVLSS